jgi:hypothetical protein
MDKVQKLSNSECYTPPSEPFRIYFFYSIVSEMLLTQWKRVDVLFYIQGESRQCKVRKELIYIIRHTEIKHSLHRSIFHKPWKLQVTTHISK